MALAPRVRVTPIRFSEALDLTAATRRHLLLGNGFSIAAHPPFTYGSLLEAAGELRDRLAAVFRELETTDFEIALNFLRQADAVLDHYEAGSRIHQRLQRDAQALKAHLVAAIARVHPVASSSLSDEQYLACRDFLALFTAPERDRRGRVFTTNYDLLLYWVMVRHHDDLACDDGFRGQPPHRWNAELVKGQSLFFLHGGLHLFEADEETYKLHYRGEANLLDQIRGRLEENQQPLFVSEGSSAQKMLRIAESEYLTTAHRSFRKACRSREAALFTVGHSLSNQDHHITDAIGRGRIPAVYIGAHGGIHSNDGIRARQLAQRWRNLRGEAEEISPLEVFVFNSNACEIWEQL